MSTTTPNLNLVKPDGNERALVSDINGNMDLIDSAVGDLQDSVSRKLRAGDNINTSSSHVGVNGEIVYFNIATSTDTYSLHFRFDTQEIRLYKNNSWVKTWS